MDSAYTCGFGNAGAGKARKDAPLATNARKGIRRTASVYRFLQRNIVVFPSPPPHLRRLMPASLRRMQTVAETRQLSG